VKRGRNVKGFSLVEVLVVMVVMGLVVGAIYATYLSTQRHAYTQEEVIEVQQNLRAALDYMVKDIRMAQFMTPTDETALVTTPSRLLNDANDDGDYEDTDERPVLSLVSATSMHGYARITGVASDSSTLTLNVASGTMQQFADSDRARVFRPEDLEAVTGVYTVTGAPSGDQVVLDISGGGYAPGDVSVGDLLVLLPAGAAAGDFPLQIDYRLTDDATSTDAEMNQLQRRVMDRDGHTVVDWELIASKISVLDLTYLDENGDPTTDLDEIVAVQVAIIGQTDATRTGRSNFSGVKHRALATTVKIHNEVRL
jgi:prepilin-type N-terminal cleavage/methylation domain-containing protein